MFAQASDVPFCSVCSADIKPGETAKPTKPGAKAGAAKKVGKKVGKKASAKLAPSAVVQPLQDAQRPVHVPAARSWTTKGAVLADEMGLVASEMGTNTCLRRSLCLF